MERTNEINMYAVALAITAEMSGWTAEKDESDRTHAWLVHPDGMRLSLVWLNYGAVKNRVRVTVARWPKYFEDGQERRTGPADLRPVETAPEITVAIARGISAIVREISRRMLPDYERIWRRLSEMGAEHERRNQEERASWAEIARALGEEPNHGTYGGTYYIDHDGGHIVVQNRGGRAYVEFYTDAAGLKATLAALKAEGTK